jgi:hypothetical protein
MEAKTIIVINDNTSSAEHAALLALKLAQKIGANIVLANEVKVAAEDLVSVHQVAAKDPKTDFVADTSGTLLTFLQSESASSEHAEIGISQIDISGFTVDDLSGFVIKNHIWMIVKGTDTLLGKTDGLHFNIQYVLNKVMCPLLLVPANFKIKDFEQIAYLADLRYCRLPIVRYLCELAEACGASVYIDHLSAKGLPNMDENYADSFFNTEFKGKVKYDRLFFNNIRERNISKAVDVMIDGMHINLLAFVNHRFHFEEILGRIIPEHMPTQITIPVLIFPY